MSGSDGGSLLFLALPLLFLGYVFMTQRRRVKGIQAMQSAITVGDRIRTTAGLFGTVTALTDTEMSLEVAPGVVVRHRCWHDAGQLGDSDECTISHPRAATGALDPVGPVDRPVCGHRSHRQVRQRPMEPEAWPGP